MDMMKTGIFSMVGRPNAGKSTLLNTLCGSKIAIVSDKPQTTRNRITGIMNDGEYQLVFVDTPGLHKPKNRLGDYMVDVINSTVADVDAVLLLVEPVARIGVPEKILIERIRELEIPAVLLINKIDTLEDKEKLLEIIALYSREYAFEAVIPISARNGDGADILRSQLKKMCIESPQLYPDGMRSDQPLRQQIAEIIREKMLSALEKEVPHGVAIEIETLERRENGVTDIGAVIYCERKTHKGIIIGKGGGMLKLIGAQARIELEELTGGKVFLELWVKVKEDWRNNPAQVRNFGYRQE
jgi:GTP-binding protein Era